MRFHSLPQNALKKIYKARCARLRLSMINVIPTDIRWLIEVKVQLTIEFSNLFVSYIPRFSKSTFAERRRAKRLGSKCHIYIRLDCNQPQCKNFRNNFKNHKNKIKFVKMA